MIQDGRRNAADAMVLPARDGTAVVPVARPTADRPLPPLARRPKRPDLPTNSTSVDPSVLASPDQRSLRFDNNCGTDPDPAKQIDDVLIVHPDAPV